MANPEQALFDSWQQGRKQGMSAGIRYEQERIIKLLEEAKPLQETDELEWGIDSAIALIKGKAE